MIIKTIALGDKNEAFIENNFSDKTNIIFSNENNRGKTLVMQGILYSIGYDSIFPTGFIAKNYFFYTEIIINNRTYEFLRKGNSIIVLNNEDAILFNSITEFKYYFDKEIIKLPEIIKDGQSKKVDLSLLYELFFLGQDKRNTSNLISKGQNNKVDFLNMIYSIVGVKETVIDSSEIESLKNQRNNLKVEIKSEQKKIAILKKNPNLAIQISSTGNIEDYKRQSLELKELNNNITEIRKRRNREENRKIKLESLFLELSSLNRNLNEGKVRCADCGSKQIIFTNEDFDFDVSNDFVRQKILNSIRENIQIKKEIIREFNTSIESEQENIIKLLDNIKEPEAKNYILFEEEINNSTDIDLKVRNLEYKLEEIENQINSNTTIATSNISMKSDTKKRILDSMKDYYQYLGENGRLEFDDVFTKVGETYSGSETQEYYFCKLLAINNVLNHDYPIIIDSFREGELSTSKEEKMISQYKKLNKQVILTSTLKKEEYNSNKYFIIDNINVIDYSDIPDSKLLSDKYLLDFKKILNKFNLQ